MLPPTVIITLPYRTPSRTARLKQHMDEQSIPWMQFNGIDGRQWGIDAPTHPYLDDWSTDHWAPPWGTGTTPPFNVGPGVHGLCATWFAICKMGLAMGWDEMLVMEDDIELCRPFVFKYENFRANLPKNYGMAFGGWCCLDGQTPKVLNHAVALAKPLCTHCVLIDKRAMELIDKHSMLWTGSDIFFFKKIYPLLGHEGNKVPISWPEQLATQLTQVGKMPSCL